MLSLHVFNASKDKFLMLVLCHVVNVRVLTWKRKFVMMGSISLEIYNRLMEPSFPKKV